MTFHVDQAGSQGHRLADLMLPPSHPPTATFPGFSPEMTEQAITRQKDFASEPLSLVSPAFPTYPLGLETITIHPSVSVLG